MPLPTFPEFQHLEIDHQSDIDAVTSQLPPYSDHHFTALWSWNVDGRADVSVIHGNVAFMLIDYLSRKPLYTFLGTNRVDHSAEALAQYSGAVGLGHQVKLIPEEVASRVSADKFDIEDDRDHADYVLYLPDRLDLFTPQNKAKRKSVGAFERLYGAETASRPLNLGDDRDVMEVLRVFDEWGAKKGIEQSEIDNERNALERLIQISDRTNLLTTGLLINGRLIGFSIDEIINTKHALGHFQKADTAYKGAYQYLDHVVNQALSERGVEFINIEQDMGIENLRAAKMAHHPYALLGKYTLTLKQPDETETATE